MNIDDCDDDSVVSDITKTSVLNIIHNISTLSGNPNEHLPSNHCSGWLRCNTKVHYWIRSTNLNTLLSALRIPSFDLLCGKPACHFRQFVLPLQNKSNAPFATRQCPLLFCMLQRCCIHLWAPIKSPACLEELLFGISPNIGDNGTEYSLIILCSDNNESVPRDLADWNTTIVVAKMSENAWLTCHHNMSNTLFSSFSHWTTNLAR